MCIEPSNNDRAAWAMAAVRFFAEQTGMDMAGEDLPTILGDLFADLMHLCQANQIDFKAVLSAANIHFSEEKNNVSRDLNTGRFLSASKISKVAGSNDLECPHCGRVFDQDEVNLLCEGDDCPSDDCPSQVKKKYRAKWGKSYVKPEKKKVKFSFFSEGLGYTNEDRQRIAKLAVGQVIHLDAGDHSVKRIK